MRQARSAIITIVGSFVVNRTGQGIRAPELERRSSVSAVIPTVQINQQTNVNRRAGESALAAGVILNDVNAKIQDRLDIQAEIDGQKQGAIDGQEGLPNLKDDATIRGRAYNRSAKDAASVEFDLNSRMMLSELEEKYSSNPVEIKSKGEAYLNGALPKLQNFDPALAQNFEANFRLRQDSVIKRASAKRDAIARDRQMESALRMQLVLNEDLNADAMELVTGDPNQVQSTLSRMTSSAAKLSDISSQIGADGRSLFSARERIAMSQSAQDAVGRSVGAAWMATQEDLLSGYESWKKGEASITVMDEEGFYTDVNMRDLVGSRVYSDVQQNFMEKLKSDITLENQIDGYQDRLFDENADKIFTDLSSLGQDRPLSLNVVEAVKSQLSSDQYLSLRAIAKNQSPTVSDGEVVARLTLQDIEGYDVRDEARAEFEAGNLSNEDFLGIYKNNKSTLTTGTKDPVTVGRTFLAQNLGNLSKELGLAQSATIGQATAEYEIEIGDFAIEKNRQPTAREARDIAEKISQRFSVMAVDNDISTLPLPKSITQAEKNSKNLNSTNVREKLISASKSYLDKNNGDVVQRDNDPDFIRETILLKKYYDRLIAKEAANASSQDGR